jgi:hypothetical protein
MVQAIKGNAEDLSDIYDRLIIASYVQKVACPFP